MPKLEVKLKSTSEYSVLCAGSRFDFIAEFHNTTTATLHNVTFQHCLGKGLEIECLPKGLVEVDPDLPLPAEICSAPLEDLPYLGCVPTSVVGRIPFIHAHKTHRVRYTVKVTQCFPFPSKASYLTVKGFQCGTGGCEAVCVQSNRAWLGATPPTPKPFTISKPVPCYGV